MTTIYLIAFVIGVFFVVRGLIDICREMDRANEKEADE